MQAVILVGGKGTRLSPVLEKMNLPKPMVPVLEKPFLEYLILMLKEKGIRRFVFCTGHLSNKIEEYFKDGKKFDIEIVYSKEEIPLFSAGALKLAEKLLDEDFIVVNGDNYHNINFSELLSFHKTNDSFVTLATTVPSETTKGMSAHIFSEKGKVKEYYGKDDHPNKNFAITGTFVVKKKVLENLNENEPISLENEIIPRYIQEGKVFSYCGEGYYLDIGTPERYNKFIDDVKNGLVYL